MRTIAFSVAWVIGAWVLWPVAGAAQVTVPPGILRPAEPSGWTVEGQEVEGTVTGVDPRQRTITLDNGEEYFVPPPVHEPLTAVGTGANVRLRYGIQGGRNIVTALQHLP